LRAAARIAAGLMLFAAWGASFARSAEPMRLGIEINAEPMSFVSPTGQAEGFTLDLIHAISKEMEFPITEVVGPWGEIFSKFKSNDIDVLVSLAYTPERDGYIDFAVSHLTMQGAFFVKRGAHALQRVEDLNLIRLGVQPNSFAHEYVKAHGWDRHLVFVPTLREALHALDEGKCDAVAAIGIIGTHIARRDGLRDIVMSDVSPGPLIYRLHMGVHAGDAKRLATLNEGLARIRANGRYDQIYEKWIGPLEARQVRMKDLRPYVLPGLVLLAGGFCILIWQRRVLERMRAHAEALRESEERLSLVMEGSEDGFWYWDLLTGRIERSERAAAILGYTLAEMGTSIGAWIDLIHPDDIAVQQPLDEFLAAVARNEITRFDAEYRMMTKSGEWRWVHTRGKVVARDEKGQATRMSGSLTDITERKRTEAALRESEVLLKRSAQLLEQTQAAAHVGGWEIDLRTDRLFWTDETYRIHEVEPSAFQPTVEKAIDFYTPESRPIIRNAVNRAIKEGTGFDVELDLITGLQRRIKVNAIGRAELENGRVVKIYGSFNDITEQKKALQERDSLQGKMLEAQKLESLGVLAGGIAHDFNNLLTVILANASFVRNSTTDATERGERMSMIETAARRAADMCRQMLAYAGRGSFVTERVSLSSLVQDTARLLLVSISKKARIELALDPRLPPVDADPSQLRQVVMNLVLNASEALGDNPGEIRVSTRLGRPETLPGSIVHAFDLPDGDCVCLEVVDTGTGMSPATLARIFDPFFTTKFAGRGLGLAAVLGIVRAHHGALTVVSAPDRGTTFRLFLPPAAGASWPSAATRAPSEAARPGHGTILIADDEPIVLSTADLLLRHHGYKTLLATDGTEAVKHFRANPTGFVAVLLDLTMPGLNGAEALREIRALNPEVRILLMTGYSEQDVLDRLNDQGPVAILHKPFTHESLLARISEVTAAPPQ
jgi:PAS domain S-box-containing protein